MEDRTSFNQPRSTTQVPRFAGPVTFMRLPTVDPNLADALDIGIFGVPWDGGATNQPGQRHAPRQLREMSTMMGRLHQVHRLSPYDLANVADLGDSPVNPVDLADSIARIEKFYEAVHAKNIRPLMAGGDHLCTLPALRVLGRDRPVGMVHFDSHSDLWDDYFDGFKLTHGTPFRRAIEEGVLDPTRTVQIGLRGGVNDFNHEIFGRSVGVRMMNIQEAVTLGPEKVAAVVRDVVGDGPTYVTFDIDCIDPGLAPGTGTPEVGGFLPREAQAMLRGLRGLDIVGADVVEVSPLLDPSGSTALIGATMLWELVCLMAIRVDMVRAGRDLT